MYLTEAQLRIVLQNPYFSQPYTENTTNYVFYRGHINAIVHTLRFNVIDSLNEEYMMQTVLTYLMNLYDMGTELLGSVSYDLLLEDPNTKSYYVWRANSNSSFDFMRDEAMFPLTYERLYRLITTAYNVHVSDLNIYFSSSNVKVSRLVAVVLSFIKL